MRLFRRTKKSPETSLFTDHIESIQEIVGYYQKALRDAQIGKSPITIYDDKGTAIHVCTPELAGLAVSRHTSCLVTLQKMQEGKKITSIEHESLLEVPFFQQQTEITNYAHIEKPLKRKYS